MEIVDLTGLRFGSLTAIKKSDRKSQSGAMWACLCDCGEVRVVASLKLRTGKTVSCGCKKKTRKTNLTHGYANKTPTYRTWKEMRQRCTNPKATQYKWYGGQGITVCDRWSDFTLFFADMGERPENCTLDRINPDGNYEPSNCRWATPKEQATTNRGVFKKGLVPKNKLPQETWERAWMLIQGGASLADAAKAVGVSYTHCCTKVKQLSRSKGKA